MTFEEAFRKSALQYFKGLSPDELKLASDKKNKYSKKYFDKIAMKNEIDQSDLEELKDA